MPAISCLVFGPEGTTNGKYLSGLFQSLCGLSAPRLSIIATFTFFWSFIRDVPDVKGPVFALRTWVFRHLSVV